MIILGIDPGLQSTGFGAIKWDNDRPVLIRAGYIKTSPKTHISSRLFQIYSDINTLIKETEPELVAVENVFSLIRYPRAGIVLGSVIGVIYLSVFQQNLMVMEVTPKEVKNALVGYGNANKRQIREMIQRELNIPNVSSFHAADALAVALTAFYRKTVWRI